MVLIQPTNSSIAVDHENNRWNTLFGGESFYYGLDPGPLVRRAVRYHRSAASAPGRALDAGCGEGQDLLFLAQQGYAATGIEFTANGAAKAKRLLKDCRASAQVQHDDLRHCTLESYDLVIAVNSIQFLGAEAPHVLHRLKESVTHGGVLALSLFARGEHQAEVENTIWRTTLGDLQKLLEGWQFLEASNLWQWNTQTNLPQAFVTIIARKKS